MTHPIIQAAFSVAATPWLKTLDEKGYQVTKKELASYLKLQALLVPIHESLNNLMRTFYFKALDPKQQEDIQTLKNDLDRAIIARAAFKIVPKSVGALPPILTDDSDEEIL